MTMDLGLAIFATDESVTPAWLATRAERPIGVTVNAAPSRPERLARYAEAGVERCVFYVPSAGADAVEAKIERVLDSVAQVGLR